MNQTTQGTAKSCSATVEGITGTSREGAEIPALLDQRYLSGEKAGLLAAGVGGGGGPAFYTSNLT